MRFSVKSAAAVSALALVGSLAACGSSAPAAKSASTPATSTVSPSAPAVSAQPANPVTILRETGATLPAGTEVGQIDVNGDRYASASYPWPGGGTGEQLTVYTYADQSAMDSAMATLAVPQDGEAFIVGHLWVMEVTAVEGSATTADGFYYQVSPKILAAETHGTLQP